MPLSLAQAWWKFSRSCESFWSVCCTERVLSPAVVLSIHATLVTVIVSHRPGLQHPESRWELGVWLLVAATVGCYLLTSLTDPGWVRLPASEQPERKSGCCSLLWGCCCCCCYCCSSVVEEADRGVEVQELQPSATQQGTDVEKGCELPPGAADARRVQKRRGPHGGVEEALEGEVPMQSGQELRWCRKCKLYQPLRTKHCHDCGRCVRTHDHHCPWVGTCVGENNRVIFYWFLLLQCTELAVFFDEGLRGISIMDPSVILMVSLLIIAMFFLMVLCLLSFHSFLMVSNLTTWEHSSRAGISYMKNVPIERVSPFTRPMLRNAAAYCCGPRWCPGSVRRLASLRYDEDGGVLWEVITDSRLPCCLLRCCADTC